MNNYFYDIKEKLAAIGGKRKLTESVKDAAQAVPGYVPDDIDEDQGFAPDEIQLDEDSVDTQQYSWGNLKIIRHGLDYSIILHPEHLVEIGNMQNHDSIRIKTETGDVWDVTLDDDELIFDEMHGSSRSVVPYSAIIDHDRLDELSPKTLGSYVKKAAQDSREASYASAADYERGNVGRHERGLDHSDKRQRGIERAVDKLAMKESGFRNDMIRFSIDSEKAYEKVLGKFGHVIDWDEDVMTVPPKYWSAIQTLAHDFGGEANEEGSEFDLDERAGPVGGGKWQDKMHLEEESDDMEDLLSNLRKAYGNIEGIDPDSPTYTKLIDFLDNIDREHLQVLADAGVKFVSMLAKNRLRSGADKLNELSKNTLGNYAKEDLKKHTDAFYGKKNVSESDCDECSMVNELSKNTATKYIKKASAGATDFGDVPEKRKAGVYNALKKKHGGAKVPATEGYRVIPSLDDDYEERAGLEGPFNANGRPIYYDPKEGKYWDPKTDFYLDDEEASTLFAESFEVVVEHKGKLKRIIVDLPKAGKRKQ